MPSCWSILVHTLLYWFFDWAILPKSYFLRVVLFFAFKSLFGSILIYWSWVATYFKLFSYAAIELLDSIESYDYKKFGSYLFITGEGWELLFTPLGMTGESCSKFSCTWLSFWGCTLMIGLSANFFFSLALGEILWLFSVNFEIIALLFLKLRVPD